MGRLPKNKEIEENNEKSQETSKNLLNSLLQGYKDTHYNFVEGERYNIDSGSLLLNQFIKVRSGMILRIGGSGVELGKTSQSLLFASNYMKIVPRSKTIFIDSEGRVGEEIQKRSGLNFTIISDNWEYNTVFLLHTNVMETIYQMVNSLLRSMHEHNEYLCIIIDSIDLLTMNLNLTKEFGETTRIAGIPYLTKELFRRLALPINKYNSLFIVTSQYQSTIKLDPYSKEPPKLMEGGQNNALNHMSSYALYYRPRYQNDLILEKPDDKPDIIKNRILGVYATVEIKKSSSETTGSIIKIPIARHRIGNQIWIEKECVDCAISFEIIKRAGAWFQFSESIIKEIKESGLELKEKFQGINSVYEYFEQNKEICDWFYRKLKNIIS